jgi:hypothetical protein
LFLFVLSPVILKGLDERNGMIILKR